MIDLLTIKKKPKKVKCPDCKGSGLLDDHTDVVYCKTCKGKGEVKPGTKNLKSHYE